MKAVKDFLGKGQYFIAGALATAVALAIHPDVQAAEGAELPGRALSPITILFLVVGMVVSIFYIKAMFTVLNEAAGSYYEEDEDNKSYYAAPAWGALLAGVIAALVIWSYGVNPSLLYLGPFLAMVSPIAILYCMAQDIKNFKAAHSDSKKAASKELTGLNS